MATDRERTAARPRPRPGDELCLSVDRLAYGGEAVGRHEGLVVFASGAVPGETVRVRIRRVQRRHVEAVVGCVELTSNVYQFYQCRYTPTLLVDILSAGD